MKKIYTTLVAAIFSVALFGQVNLQNKSTLDNDNSNLNIVTQKKNSSELMQELEKLKVYPNPVSNELIVNLSNVNINIPKIEIFDITGRQVKIINVEDKGIVKIDFSDQRKGLYLLSFYNQLGEVVQISKVQKI